MQMRAFFAYLSFLICLSPSVLFGQAAGAKYPILNWQQLEAARPSAGMRLFFYLLRNDTELLQDEDVLRNFMAVNNCQNNAFARALNIEFDYPGMKAFYQSKAPEILKTGPLSLSMMLSGFYLGQYDTAKKLFPFVDSHGTKPAATVFHNLEPGNDLHDTCPMLAVRGVTQKRDFYAYYLRYQVNVQPVTVSELPMDEAGARNFVESLRFGRAGAGRSVNLLVELDIIDAPTKLGPHLPNVGYAPVNVEGRIKKITIISVETQKTLGVIVP